MITLNKKIVCIILLSSLVGCAQLDKSQNNITENKNINTSEETTVKLIGDTSNEEVKKISVVNKVPAMKKTVNPDPNVSLIAPPTALPKGDYEIPVVSEKENYVPPVAKPVKCKKGSKCKQVNTTTTVTKDKKQSSAVPTQKGQNKSTTKEPVVKKPGETKKEPVKKESTKK